MTSTDHAKIQEIAKRYGVHRVLLFGSGSSSTPEEAYDIDLAVEGISPAHFFAFYGDLIFSLSKPVDLVDLGKQNAFTRMIEKEGIAIYG